MPLGRRDRDHTHPCIWGAAIICTFLTLIVIFGGIVIFIGYLVIKPKVPNVIVQHARLDLFDSSQAGVLNTQLTIWMQAQNHNLDAHASFSDYVYDLMFHDVKIDTLRNYPFDVDKNTSILFMFEAKASNIPLDPEQQNMVSQSIKQDRVEFNLLGHTRARWRVGPLKSVKFWCNLFCDLQFHMNGTSYKSHCTPKSI